MQVECHSCRRYVNAEDTVGRTIDERIGKIGAALSFGGRAGSGASSSTRQSGARTSHGSGRSQRQGLTWRFSGGRRIYKTIQVRICKDCLAAEAVTKARNRKIIAIIIALILAWWVVPELLVWISSSPDPVPVSVSGPVDTLPAGK